PLLRQGAQGLRRHVLEFGGDGVAAPGQLGQALRVVVSGADVVVRDQARRAGRIGIEHHGDITHGLRGLHEHAAELAAAHHAQRHGLAAVVDGTGQQGKSVHRTHTGSVMARAASVCAVRKACSFSRRAGSSLASRATANSAALAAPAAPMAKVATGMPLGIWTMECSESTPHSALDCTGTPSTGTTVLAAIMPGRWAAPPAPAMIALSPRPRAASA